MPARQMPAGSLGAMTAEQSSDENGTAKAPRSDFDTQEKRRGFIRTLNDRMPKKRLIAQGILRTDGDRVLLCELVYKRDWDLPGGIVDPDESPADCVVREVKEELGLDVEARQLLSVNWLPPYRGWDDALLCLFDLGYVPEGSIEAMVLQRREIKAVHWADAAQTRETVAPYTAEMILEVAMGHRPGTVFLENSVPRAGM